MSFLTISTPGLLQDMDLVRIERVLSTRVDTLLMALDRVMPDGIRFSDWIQIEDHEIHVDLQVDRPVHYHLLELAEFLAQGARRVQNRNFAAFRREQAPERLESDKAWLDINAAVHAIVLAGGQIRFLADSAHELHLLAIDPDFVRQAETWGDDAVRVDDALLVGVKVLPILAQASMTSLLLQVEQSSQSFFAMVPDDVLDRLRPGRTRVSFEYVRDANSVCDVLVPTLLLRSTVGQRILAVCDVSP